MHGLYMNISVLFKLCANRIEDERTNLKGKPNMSAYVCECQTYLNIMCDLIKLVKFQHIK